MKNIKIKYEVDTRRLKEANREIKKLCKNIEAFKDLAQNIDVNIFANVTNNASEPPIKNPK